MRSLPLLLMLPGALLYFGSSFIAGFMTESTRNKRERNRQWAEMFAVPLDPPLPDQAETDELQKDQIRLFAKIIGFAIFNLGVLAIFL